MFDDKTAFIVKAELPGLKVEDVRIDVEKGVLTLRGERKLEKREDGPSRIDARTAASCARSSSPTRSIREKIQSHLRWHPYRVPFEETGFAASQDRHQGELIRLTTGGAPAIDCEGWVGASRRRSSCACLSSGEWQRARQD